MTREKQLLEDAVIEIWQLRKRNQFLETRLSGFEDALLLLKATTFSQSQGMTEDLVWKIEKYLKEQKESPDDIPEDKFED